MKKGMTWLGRAYLLRLDSDARFQRLRSNRHFRFRENDPKALSTIACKIVGVEPTIENKKSLVRACNRVPV